MAYNRYENLSGAGNGYLLTAEFLFSHLNVYDVGDDGDNEYICRHLLPAAWMIAESFCNRAVVPTDQVMEDCLDRIARPDEFDPSDRVDPETFQFPTIADNRFIQAVLLLLADLYRNREDSSPEKLQRVPNSAQALLWPLRKGLGI